MNVNVSVLHGMRSLNVTGNWNVSSRLTFMSSSSGASMSFVATLDDVNNALDRLTYISHGAAKHQDHSNYYGPEMLSLYVTDTGNTGMGGVLSAEASIPFPVLWCYQRVNSSLQYDLLLLCLWWEQQDVHWL